MHALSSCGSQIAPALLMYSILGYSHTGSCAVVMLHLQDEEAAYTLFLEYDLMRRGGLTLPELAR